MEVMEKVRRRFSCLEKVSEDFFHGQSGLVRPDAGRVLRRVSRLWINSLRDRRDAITDAQRP